MSCYHPITVEVGRKRTDGRPRVYVPTVVGCGSCLGCRAEQARNWSVRIMHEKLMHDRSWFVTLTYSEEEIPENGTLAPEDFRRFIKALRRDYPAGSVRYYGCGEYGERTQRPHYHAVLFGPEFLDRSVSRSSASGPIWRSEALESYWPHGIAEFGSVTHSSAAYVAGYVRKKVSRKVNAEHYTRVNPLTGEIIELHPEFSRMSLKPAIGRSWIEEFYTDVYPRDFVVIEGKEYKPPRYYDRWMDANHPGVMMEVREKRINEARELSKYQLSAREQIHEARVNLFQQRNKV